MEQVNINSPQDREKSEFVYGNEKMQEEGNSKKEPTEITKDMRRVTTNTPAFYRNISVLFLSYCSRLRILDPSTALAGALPACA